MLEEALKSALSGEVHFDLTTRRIYSIDASIYEVVPLGVVVPKTAQELIKAVKIAYKEGVPVIARGAATGIAGGCLGEGLILDTSKYLRNILEINIEKGYALCEPGVVQDRLNEALSPYGYRLGPDTSTGDRATIGGMLANNSAGARSLRYGKMSDHILEVELVLSDGECVKLSKHNWDSKRAPSTREGRLYEALFSIKTRYEKEIATHFPTLTRIVSGYNLPSLIKDNESVNLAELIAGSEGTLGIATAIKVAISKKPKECGLVLLFVDDIPLFLKKIPELLAFHPLSFEMIDSIIMEAGRRSPSLKGTLGWLKEVPKALFIIEFEAEERPLLMQLLEIFKKNSGVPAEKTLILTSKEEMESVWALRKAGLGLLLSKRSYTRAIAFIEDLSLPPEELGSFMEEFLALLKEVGKEAGIYGHVGSGCIHIRPYINLCRADEVTLMETLMNRVADLLLKYRGVPSGEHGDGLVRSWMNKKIFGETLYNAFLEVKAAFDPLGRMNPHKIVNAPPLNHNLRLSPETTIWQVDTFLDFEKEGGFSLAVDLCNGNGACRKEEGIMCPSFQASHDEYHSTRARAETLRSVVNGHLPLEALTGEDVYNVLDLCLECKGCKKECPSQVDMAKMKAELLYRRHKKRGVPLRASLFGQIDRLYRFAAPFASLFNRLSTTSFAGFLLERVGITKKRPFPPIAKERFSQWLKKEVPPLSEPVLLFNDTFTEYNFPSIGKSAYRVLVSMGYSPIVPPYRCCGRPAFSKGLLEVAREKAEALIDMLYPYAKKGIPIIGLEPSCLFMLKEDYEPLVSLEYREKAKAIAELSFPFDRFLFLHLDRLPLKSTRPHTLLIHTHCHQKALMKGEGTLEVLNAIENIAAKEIPSGCCGLAGSFGYEREHYDFSLKIGNLKLVPAIKAALPGTLIIANGASCRSQITHQTTAQPLHLAEFLDQQIQLFGYHI